MAVEKLQMLGNAAKRYGGTTEGIAGTLENLRSQHQTYITEGGGGLEQAAFKYGVGISSDPEKMLENVAKRMETMRSDAAKWDLANTLGIDEATTRLLMQGQKAYNEELKKAEKYKLYTKEDIERMRQYRQLSLDLRMSLDGIVGSIARMLLPAIISVTKVVRNIVDFAKEHEGGIKLIAIFASITIALLAARQAILLYGKALKWLNDGGVKTIATFLKNPFILWAVGLTLLIALIQDFIVFMQGGESIIGKILEKMGVDTDKLRENIKNFFNNIKEWIKQALEWLTNLGGKFKELADTIKSLFNTPDQDIDIVKKVDLNNLNPEQRARLEEIQKVQANPFDTIKKGKNIINAYNENPLNAMPQGAQSFYYSTESRNMTSNKNAKSITNSNSRTTNIGQMNVNVQANNPKEFMDKTSQLASMDNGIM